MATDSRLLVTGWSLHLPGVDLAALLAGSLGRPEGDWAGPDQPEPAKAAAVLGRKGLLYKEPATRLALCAVHRALELPAGRRPDWPASPRTAVVACSNLGNVQTVAQVTRTIAEEGGGAVSVLDAPNVSSNIVASAVALWFGFGGPNLMICSGSTAGLDGLAMAGLLLRARRADRVVLVGAEPADEVAEALYGTDGSRPPLRAGAACVILEPWRPGAAGRATVEAGPATGWSRPANAVIGPDGFDLTTAWGDGYGAHGVVALALAAHLAADEGHDAVGVVCAGEDGSRAALVCSTAAGAGGHP